VRSPLAEIGFTKDAIRRLSRARGIQTWSQPASPCLSSRIPYGTSVTVERLRQIESAERALRVLGVIGDLRVRYHGDLARIELAPDAIDEWFDPSRRRALSDALRAVAFDRVALDVRGFRSGSLNVLGGVVAEPLVRARSAVAVGDANAFRRSLAGQGITCEVQSRDRLAVVRAGRDADIERFREPEIRRFVLDAARSHGFTHVAVDLAPVDDATLRRD
jgi:PP-loop superfamily ATP-utilizing enzyme